MTARTLEILAKVRDAASSKLKKVQKELRKTGKAAKRTGVDFTEFNRIMFSTTAFIGLFTNAMRGVGDAMMHGAQVDRVSTQFERVMGPKGAFFKTITNLTDNTIDRMEAMRSGIALKSLGIAGNMGEVAGIVAQAGTAAKLAGKDSAEGVKQYTNFLKTGSIASLSFLNIIAETNPALQAQLAILQKAGGPLGKVITTQQKLAIGAALLSAATKDQMKNQRDLLDVMKDSQQAFSFLRAEAGKFLGTAFAPLIDKVTNAVFAFTDLIERVRTGDKEFLQFTKNLIIAGGAITSVLASLGTARLLFKALGALGLGGIPFIAMTVVGLAASFSDLDKGLSRVTKVFKLFGAVIMGSGQLMASFLNNSDNAARGIGKMDSALHDMLDEAGLLGFVTNLSRAGVVAVEFGKGVVDGIKSALDFVNDKFGGAIDKIKEFLGLDTGAWSKDILKDAKSVGVAVGKIGIAVLGAWGAFKLLGGAKSLLSKIPIIGRFFGGGKTESLGGVGGTSGKPSGTLADPVYVIIAGMGGSTGFPGQARLPRSVGGGGTTILGGGLGGVMAKLKGWASKLGGILSKVGVAMLGFAKALPLARLGLLGLAAAAGVGIGMGVNALDKKFLGGAIGSGIGSSIDWTAGLFGVEGSSAEQARMAELQNSSAYSDIIGASRGAGAGIGARESLAMTQALQNSIAGGSPRGAEIARFQNAMFAKKLANPGALGITGSTITSQPTMPTNEFYKKRQIQETMKMLDEDTSGRMQVAFTKAIQDSQISKEEWVDIYKAGMDKSEVAANTKPGAEKPDHSAAKIKRGC